MLRIVLFIWIMVSLTKVGWTNNVRIMGDVRVEDITSSGIATIKFTVEWENSWRDAYNHDGVYLFFKYKKEGVDGWHHAYLMKTEHNAPNYDYCMQGPSSIEDRCEGIIIYRNSKGNGTAKVDLELKWDIRANTDCSLVRDNFVTGIVSLSAMGMEMVYLPRGAFRAGDSDSESDSTFKNQYVTIPPDKDILSGTNKSYTYTSSEQANDEEKGANPPEFAVNRVNATGINVTTGVSITGTKTNAWVGVLKTGENHEWWRVDFDVAKTIYNIAIESVPNGAPTEWVLEGRNDVTWVELYKGTGADWMTTSRRTYPCSHAIKVEKTDEAYKHIRIRIDSSAVPVVINNVAMTTENILESVDNSVVVGGQRTSMGNVAGFGDLLYADDGDSWTGVLPITYPNGFPAFWSMKYEISQEQYVMFLNKLLPAQQKSRTILHEFENLKDGEYVFGLKRNAPTARNGIILAKQGKDGKPHVFANNLNSQNGHSQEGGGQTLACNFLTPADMLAYADWCGLRPLTELEYEKMARRPFPYPALRNEYAWNTDMYVASTALNASGQGSKTETLTNGYVNAENGIGGPVRCGAYATIGTSQTDAGASFWGVMELSGNVAEIYYNANTEGRAFHGNLGKYHGNGVLAASGNSDMASTFWSVNQNAFALRGGSFASKAPELRISDRSRHKGVYVMPNDIYTKRDSTVGFRLGATAPILSGRSEIILQNGMTSADAQPIDTICSGDDYVIDGTMAEDITGFVQIAWWQSVNNGHSWDLIHGEQDPSLKISKLINVNEEMKFLKEYQFIRKIFTGGSEYRETTPVKIRVVDHDLYISSLRDTVDVYDHSNGITMTSKQRAEFKLYWVRPNSGNREFNIEHELESGYSYRHFFRYSDFNEGAQISNREENVVLRTEIMGHCLHIDTLKVFVMPEPKREPNIVSSSSILINQRTGGQNSAMINNPNFKCGDILVDSEPMGQDLEYKTVQIDNRCWFAENLRRNVAGSLCYGNNPQNCEKFGRLYNWNTAVGSWENSDGIQGICPTGWHIPTDSEWSYLHNYVGGAANLSSQLNSWSWKQNTTARSNTSRFSALPTGAHAQNDYTSWWTRFNGYAHNNIVAIWWSTTYSYHPNIGYYGTRSRASNVPHTTYIQYNNRSNSQNGYFGMGINYGDVNGVSIMPGTGNISTGSSAWFIELCCHHSINYAFGGDNYHVIRDRIHIPVRCIKDGVEPVE